jgi:alpha-tubulin suppressor-like RCC1 family protein
MRVKLVVSVCGVAAMSFVMAGCGASAATPAGRTVRGTATATPISPQQRREGVVYEWGRAGGGLINPGRAFGWGPNHRDRFVSDPDPRGGHQDAILGIGPTRVVPTPVQGIDGTVRQVATSNSTGYALTRAGAVYAWGTGSQGELGNGTDQQMATTAVRVDFPAGVRIAKLPNPMPYDGGMAIDTRGNAWAWGNDEGREFCQPRGRDYTFPIRVPLSHVTLAAGAWRHAIYDAGGRVVSCGLSDHGQLGNGSIGRRADSGTPVPVQGLPAGRVVTLTSAFGNAGALMANGAYYDWGIDTGGQVGDGTRIGASTAVRVHLPGRVHKVFQGGSFASNGQTMVLLRNGQLWVWGANASGQLGNGTIRDSLRPIRLDGPQHHRFVSISSGGASDYAIGRSGRLWAWGQNSEGELGDGSANGMATRPVDDSLHVTQVSATARNAAALATPTR